MRNERLGHRAITAYYLLTPLFVLIDYFYGSNIRVTALDAYPGLKYLYYGVCCLSSLWMLRSPVASQIFALVESSINILLLIVGMLTPYLRALEAARQGEVIGGLTEEWIVNFMLASSVAAVAFYSNPLIWRRGMDD